MPPNVEKAKRITETFLTKTVQFLFSVAFTIILFLSETFKIQKSLKKVVVNVFDKENRYVIIIIKVRTDLQQKRK